MAKKATKTEEALSEEKVEQPEGDMLKALKLLEQRVHEMHRPFGTVLPQIGWSRRPFEYCGQKLDRGQLVNLMGARNDEKLFRIGYIQDLPSDFDVEKDFAQCGSCGAKFLNYYYLENHGQQKHSNRCPCGEVFESEKDLRPHMLRCAVGRNAIREMPPG